MGVIITGRYLGAKKMENLHEQSGSKLTTVAPLDNAGDGSSFSPTDLLATSFASCVLTTIAIKGESTGISLERSHYRVEKIMTPPPRRVGELRAEFHLPGALSEEQRRLFEATARACPVHRSLHPDVILTMAFHYDV